MKNKKKSFLNIPKSLEDAKKQLIDVQHNLTYKGNKFCFVSYDENIFIFTCKKNLEFLQSAEHVFGDGTFSFAPKYFVQLYTIHVYPSSRRADGGFYTAHLKIIAPIRYKFSCS